MSYLFKNVRERSNHLTIYRVNKRGTFNPTAKDRVNKSISNNIKLIKSKQVYTSPTPTYDTYFESLDKTFPTQHGVNIWGYFKPTPINRVNNAISITNILTYKCHTLLETS